MAFLEDKENLQTNNNLINKWYAVSYTSRIPTVRWNRVWILTESWTNTPIQEIAALATTWLDITTTPSTYNAYFNNTDVVSGWNTVLTSVFTATDKTIAKLDTSLVWYWDMETLTGWLLRDFSNYNNNWTLSWTLTVWNVKWKVWYATSLDWAWWIIEIPNSASLNPAIITMCAWAQRNWDNTQTYSNVVYKENWTSKLWYNLAIDKSSDNLLFRTLWSATNYDLTSNNMKIASMNHYCWIYNAWTLSTYKNWVKTWSRAWAMSTSTVNLTIWWATTLDTINWIIDEVRIYNRVLSDAEIENLYNAKDE
jgi:hypothetical protein